MSDYRVFNDNGYERTWEELYEDNVSFQKYTDKLEQENKILKEKYENAVADYETTMFEKEQLNSLVNSCQEEIRQLKKQLEEYKRLGFKHLNDKCNKLENQQKAFIEYLENMLDNENDIFSVVRVKDVLQKYEEIIGDDK